MFGVAPEFLHGEELMQPNSKEGQETGPAGATTEQAHALHIWDGFGEAGHIHPGAFQN